VADALGLQATLWAAGLLDLLAIASLLLVRDVRRLT
jgi:hypothetical protein